MLRRLIMTVKLDCCKYQQGNSKELMNLLGNIILMGKFYILIWLLIQLWLNKFQLHIIV